MPNSKKPTVKLADIELTRQSSATATPTADSTQRKATSASDDGVGDGASSFDRQQSSPKHAGTPTVTASDEETALFPMPAKLPSSSMGANNAAGEHQRRHTGFDFDYTPGEAHRLSVRHESTQTQERRTTLHSQPVKPSATNAPLLEFKDDNDD